MLDFLCHIDLLDVVEKDNHILLDENCSNYCVFDESIISLEGFED